MQVCEETGGRAERKSRRSWVCRHGGKHAGFLLATSQYRKQRRKGTVRIGHKEFQRSHPEDCGLSQEETDGCLAMGCHLGSSVSGAPRFSLAQPLDISQWGADI